MIHWEGNLVMSERGGRMAGQCLLLSSKKGRIYCSRGGLESWFSMTGRKPEGRWCIWWWVNGCGVGF